MEGAQVKTIVDLITSGGLVTLLLVILLSGAKGKWVFGHQYDELRKERDQWRDLALKATGAAQDAVTIGERLSKAVQP